MNRPIAAVDSDVLIWLLDTGNSAEARRKRALVELAMEHFNKLSARWVVPAPVVAELFRDRAGSLRLRDVARKYLGAIRVEALDMRAADVAGEIHYLALRSRPRGQSGERNTVKFDALIAGTAHCVGARWLLTANVDDMKAHLKAIGSTVEVVNPTEPTGSQTVFVDILKPGAAPARDAEATMASIADAGQTAASRVSPPPQMRSAIEQRVQAVAAEMESIDFPDKDLATAETGDEQPKQR